MKLKKAIWRMLEMCPLSWYITKRTLQLCCVLLIGSCALLSQLDGGLSGNYKMYMTAIALNEIAQALLLISVVCAVTIEDIQS